MKIYMSILCNYGRNEIPLMKFVHLYGNIVIFKEKVGRKHERNIYTTLRA